MSGTNERGTIELLSSARRRDVRASTGAEFVAGNIHASALDHLPPSKVTP
ncbi:MAG TPA: hypothetical protein VNM39_19535 [Verrucomicrobiae bacterium]|nr:hypothetical protein [Verrucomicrobiae bacterium]